MKSFNFKSAANTKEAAKLISNRSIFLAGGMSIIPAIKLGLAAYSDLINIKKIKSLSGIKVSSKSVKIGSTTKHVEVSISKEIGKAIPSLAVLAEGIGDPQVRNRGTIGGSIANNDPAADYPAACLALNAIIHTSKRKIPADKFFKGMFETDLKKGELIETVEFEVPEICDSHFRCLRSRHLTHRHSQFRLCFHRMEQEPLSLKCQKSNSNGLPCQIS